MAAIRTVIVDDSAVVRKHLSDLLTAGGIEVLATAQDPLFAWPKIQSLKPDVIVLDVEMPRMDGITFLKKIMSERPTPVVICSTLTEQGAETTMQALAAGATSIIPKPKMGLKQQHRCRIMPRRRMDAPLHAALFEVARAESAAPAPPFVYRRPARTAPEQQPVRLDA